MLASLSQFHFLRPEWFLALVPVVLLLLWLRFEKSAQGDWHSLIPEYLLKHIIHEQVGGSSRQAITLLALLWMLCVIALAGPTWSKLPQPVYEKIAARVYILDLSYSMYAGDLKPDRISRARLKLIDLLKNKREGLSALVVFSGNSHVVTPLTNDTNTIISLVPALEPDIMPNIGNNPSEAVQKALGLLANTKVEQGQIILISDEVTEQHIAPINALMESSPYSLSILGVGTEEGAPIKMPNGQFLKDGNTIVVPKLNSSTLKNLATNNKGTYVSIQQNDRDIQALQSDNLLSTQDAREGSQQFDIWFEAGQWLMFPILALAALAFRRGWILSLMLSMVLYSPLSTNTLYAQQAQAEQGKNKTQNTFIDNASETIASWFKTGDQRGFEKFRDKDFQQAAKLFNNTDWRGASLFYSGQFAQASELFNTDNNNTKQKQSSAWYNKANALAFAGDLNGAIEAYDKSLALDPDNEDAAFNKQLVEELKKQKEEQEQQDQQQQNEQQEQSSDNSESSLDQNQQEQSSQQDKSQDSETSQEQSNQEQDSEQNPEQESGEEQEQQQENKQETDSEQEPSEQEKEQQQENQTDQDNQEQAESDLNDSEQSEAAMEESALDREKQQALEQWLRQVPDDPSGLLRRKFQLEHQRNRNNQNTNQQAW